MDIDVIKTGLDEISDLRVLFLHESNFQFIYNKCHSYGWADIYQFKIDGMPIGYGCVWGRYKRGDRDAIFEFYVLHPYRKFINEVFSNFCVVSKAAYIECQSNDVLLGKLIFEYAGNINAQTILFKDRFQTDFKIPGIIFQKRAAEINAREDEIQYLLKHGEEIVATGGLMLNYNPPYADIYYEVNENYRRLGFGSLIVQELKRAAYGMGKIPAARCNIKNMLSKATLLKMGFVVCGYILCGGIISGLKKTEN